MESQREREKVCRIRLVRVEVKGERVIIRVRLLRVESKLKREREYK